MAEALFKVRDETALQPNHDANKEITVVQQKLESSVLLYLQNFCKENPSFSKDTKAHRDHVPLEMERFWPDDSPEAKQLWRHFDELVHAIPPAGTSSLVLLRIYVVSAGIMARASLPQPQEAAAKAAFDITEGVVRSYVVPVFKELPSFDSMSISAGLMVECQSVPPMFNELHDNRTMGMGAGADIYGARSVDKLLGGNDGEDEKFRTPTLGMPWGMGGPAILGVPAMGQPLPPEGPPQVDHEDEEPQTAETAVVGAAAAAELEHIVHHHAHDRHRREEAMREQDKQLLEQKNLEAERREQARRQEERLLEERQREERLKRDEQRQETEVEANRLAGEVALETVAVEATEAIERAEISDLAKESVIAEAEITSPEGTSSSGRIEGPTRPESLGSESAALTSLETVEKAASLEGRAEQKQNEEVEARNEQVEKVEVQNEQGEAKGISASEATTSETARAGEGASSEATKSEVSEAELTSEEEVTESGEKRDPTFITGSEGSAEVGPVSIEAAANTDDQSEDEVSPEELKDALDKIKEQMGDKEEFLAEDTSFESTSSIERVETVTEYDEGLADETVSRSPEPSSERTATVLDQEKGALQNSEAAEIRVQQEVIGEQNVSLDHAVHHTQEAAHHLEHGSIQSGRSSADFVAKPGSSRMASKTLKGRAAVSHEAEAPSGGVRAPIPPSKPHHSPRSITKGRGVIAASSEVRAVEPAGASSAVLAAPLVPRAPAMGRRTPKTSETAPSLPTSTDPKLRVGAAKLGALVMSQGRKKSPVPRKTITKSAEAVLRKRRAQEWRADRKEIKAATIKKNKKNQAVSTIRLRADRLQKLTPDD